MRVALEPEAGAKLTWAETVALQPARVIWEAGEVAEIALEIRASRAIPDPGAVLLAVEEVTALLHVPVVHAEHLAWAALAVDVWVAAAGGVNNILARTKWQPKSQVQHPLR